jgi:hypothetical protein
MGNAGMLEHILSADTVMIEAAVGLSVYVGFRLLGPPPRPSTLEVALIAALTVIATHWYVGPPPGMAAPAGPTDFVGRLVESCAEEAGPVRCRCATDALRERLGDTEFARLAFRAHVDRALPREFLEALYGCGSAG